MLLCLWHISRTSDDLLTARRQQSYVTNTLVIVQTVILLSSILLEVSLLALVHDQFDKLLTSCSAVAVRAAIVDDEISYTSWLNVSHSKKSDCAPSSASAQFSSLITALHLDSMRSIEITGQLNIEMKTAVNILNC